MIDRYRLKEAIVAGRTRSTVLNSTVQDYQLDTLYSDPFGTCDDDPGPKDKYQAGPPFKYAGTTLHEHETREMTDVVTPEFHKMKRLGKIINNPMTSTYEKVYIPLVQAYMDCTYWQEKPCNPNRFVYLFDMTTDGSVNFDRVAGPHMWKDLPDVDETTLKDQAILKAWANVDRSEILAIASVGELNQTVKGLTYLFKKVHRILTFVKTRDARFLRMQKSRKNEASFKELKEVYLNARYNLRPLYYDMQAIMKIWNKSITAAMRQTFRSSIKKKTTSSDVVTFDWWDLLNWKWPVDIHRCAHKEVEVRAGVLTDCQPLSLAEMLGGESLVESAWDLTPWSFIVDWFVNAGDYISAWTPEMKVKPLASWVVTKTTTTQTSTILGSNFSYTNAGDESERVDVNSHSVGSGTAERIVVEKKREPNYSRPYLPNFRLKLDSLKLLDLGLILKDVSGFRYRL